MKGNTESLRVQGMVKLWHSVDGGTSGCGSGGVDGGSGGSGSDDVDGGSGGSGSDGVDDGRCRYGCGGGVA